METKRSGPRRPQVSQRLSWWPVWSSVGRGGKVGIILLLALLVILQCMFPVQVLAGPPAAGEDRLKQILSRGELRVGYLVWEPCVIRKAPGTPLTGIFPDMMEEIARALKVELTWHETTIANFPAGLGADQFDVFVGAIFITIPRAAAAAYTMPVAFVGNSGVVARSSSFQPRSLADLAKPDLRVAVLQGQAMDEYIRRNFPKAKLVILAGGDLTAPLAAVSAGRADVGFMNSVTVAKYVAEHPEVQPILTGSDQVETLPLAWAIRQQDRTLLDFLNASIEYFRASGRLAEYQRKYPVKLLFDLPQLRAPE